MSVEHHILNLIQQSGVSFAEVVLTTESCVSISQRTFQEICKGIHLQKSQELQTTKPENKKSNGSKSG